MTGKGAGLPQASTQLSVISDLHVDCFKMDEKKAVVLSREEKLYFWATFKVQRCRSVKADRSEPPSSKTSVHTVIHAHANRTHAEFQSGRNTERYRPQALTRSTFFFLPQSLTVNTEQNVQKKNTFIKSKFVNIFKTNQAQKAATL